ncbi:apolipoprotein N-acyltransferase [Kingella negevensis]|uniref:apolipoprotein N-acyltransferase n=1 Tax=Kingella negevensis TaxID=1522312 RepID=UPI002542CEE1|nr:apolipoprotein N-acyltransferase [Kingella negevensis]WII94206.1 apolipoprotein N-acyltransferase [Kingella negevensis]
MFAKLDSFWQKPPVYFFVLTLIAAATPFTFAPYYQFWLMPLLFGALIRLTELKPHRRVSSAYWFGVVAYATQFWWIHTALHDVSGLSNVFAIPLTFLLPMFLALYPAAAFWALGKFDHLPRGWRIGVALPMIWTLAEFARERVLTGFGWGALGYSQIASGSPLAGFAPVSGIHLVTLLTAAVSAWLVLLVDNSVVKQRIAAAAAIVGVLFSGCILKTVEWTQPIGDTTTVALAQGNISQQLKFDENALPETYRRYYNQVSQSKAQIIVLPETAFPQFLQNTQPEILNAFAQAAKQNGSALAVGVPVFTADGANYLNAMVLLSQYDETQPEKMALYAKNHLVPFGEYKPLPALTNSLYKIINMPLADFQRGGVGQKPFEMAGQKVAFNICYEDGFGDELIASARESTLLANASNMAWYGASNAMWQQLQQSQTRALELERTMIRATNTGATAIVSHKGEVVAQAQPDTEAVLEGAVQGRSGETLYMKLGGSLPLIGLLVLVLVGLKFVFKSQPEK